MNFTVMAETLPRVLEGLPLTLALVAISVSAGAVIATALAFMGLSRNRLLSGFTNAYVFVFRGTPLLVQIFLIYYGLGQFAAVRASVAWEILREPWWCAIIALTLNTSAYASEIVRGGLLAVPKGQVEAARACGMSGLLLLRRIVFPIALRQALPAYGNEIILMVKASALASTITILEITGQARIMLAETYAPIEVFLVAGALYLAINGALALTVRWLERQLEVTTLRPATIDAR